MARPNYETKSSSEKLRAYLASLPPKQQEAPAHISIYNEAKSKNQWIYDPDIKRWFTPEEFLDLEQRISGGAPNRLARMQVKDPIEGIEASFIQMQSLKDRMEIFVKRVLEYYKRK
jgi:hypothetical protein